MRFTILALIFATSTAFAASGGGSDGGGNTYRGRPLESYAKRPYELAAYKVLMELIIADVRAKAGANPSEPLDVLASMLSYPFFGKIWYFVPGPLSQIPAELLNSAVPTDQAVLQGHDAVWIDEDLWNKMTTEDRAKLLLHEAFMGMKVLQFASSDRQCLAAGRGSCRQTGSKNQPIMLKSRDYTDVQWLTIETSRDFVSITPTEWRQRIAARFKYVWRYFDLPEMVTRQDLDSRLKTATISGYLPKYGLNLRGLDGNLSPEEALRYINDHREPCKVTASLTGDKVTLQIKGKTESLSYTLPVPEKSESYFDDAFLEGKVSQRIPLTQTSRRPRPGGGYTMFNVWLGFDSFRVTHVYAQEMVCEKPDCAGGGSYDVRGGAMYICADNPRLFEPPKP